MIKKTLLMTALIFTLHADHVDTYTASITDVKDSLTYLIKDSQDNCDKIDRVEATLNKMRGNIKAFKEKLYANDLEKIREDVKTLKKKIQNYHTLLIEVNNTIKNKEYKKDAYDKLISDYVDDKNSDLKELENSAKFKEYENEVNQEFSNFKEN